MAEPITPAELRAHLNATRTDEDDKLATLIAAARSQFEKDTGLILTPRTVVDRLDAFAYCDRLELAYRPVLSGATVTLSYIDSTGADATVDDFRLEPSSLDGSISPALLLTALGSYWPATYRTRRAITISYAAGFATPAAVPDDIKLAIIIHCMDTYNNGVLTDEGARAFRSIVDRYRLMVIG